MLVFLVFQRNLCHCCSCFKTWVISKIILLFLTLSGSGPSCLSDLLLFYEHFRALRSSNRRLLTFIYHAARFFLVCYFNVCLFILSYFSSIYYFLCTICLFPLYHIKSILSILVMLFIVSFSTPVFLYDECLMSLWEWGWRGDERV